MRLAAQVPGQFPMQTAPTCNTTQGLDVFNNIRIQYQDSLKRAGALDRVGSGAFMPVIRTLVLGESGLCCSDVLSNADRRASTTPSRGTATSSPTTLGEPRLAVSRLRPCSASGSAAVSVCPQHCCAPLSRNLRRAIA